MSGGGGTTSTTTTVPDWLKPYVTGYLGTAQNVTSQPYPQYPGQQVASMAPGEQSAVQGLTNMATGTPGLLAADQQLGETLSGQGMNNYVAQAAQPAIDQAKTAYYGATSDNLARFQGANRNSSAYQTAQGLSDKNLAQGLGNATAPLYSQEYDAERNRQMQAAGLEPGINDALATNLKNSLGANSAVTQNNQSIFSNLLQQFQQATGWNQTQLNNYGNAISSITGAGKNSSTTGPSADPLSQGLGGLLLLSMFM